MPAEVADIAFYNKASLYDLLFKAASETMLTIVADRRHLGARIGIPAVLHIWGSAMIHHPHVHMIVPSGGLAIIRRHARFSKFQGYNAALTSLPFLIRRIQHIWNGSSDFVRVSPRRTVLKKLIGYHIAAILAAGACHQAAFSQAADRSFETWRNPKNSVHIRAHPCGTGMCGTVVWANEKAQADSRKEGTQKLIGAQLFRDFRQEQGVWRGKVFVPDIGKAFAGTITMVNGTTAVGKGCLVGKIGCKSQTWTRIPD